MSTRYVWERWNTDYVVIVASTNTVDWHTSIFDETLGSFPKDNIALCTVTRDENQPVTNILTSLNNLVSGQTRYTGGGNTEYRMDRLSKWNTVYPGETGMLFFDSSGKDLYIRNSSQSWKYAMSESAKPISWSGQLYDGAIGIAVLQANNVYERSLGKGSISYGNISSSLSSTYPADNHSGSNWYVYKGSDSIDPTVFISPNPGKGGELVTINITPSTGNVYGGTIKYKVTYSLDSGSETVLNESTSETSLQLLVPKGTESLTVYVTASDNMGFTGDKISTTISIINNSDPVITSEISNLGSIDSIFNIPYSVSDEDGDNISITEKIDKTVFRTFSTTSGNQNFTITDYQFLNITNDFHNIIIEADDGNGGTDTLTIPFTKALYTTTLALDSPMSTDGLVTKCYLTLTGNIPDDSELEILVSNNPYDTSPVWEDITNYVKNNWNYQFENTSVTSNQYGFDFKLTVSRGDSNTAGNIISISGGFE